jgi:hypothetical protein
MSTTPDRDRRGGSIAQATLGAKLRTTVNTTVDSIVDTTVDFIAFASTSGPGDPGGAPRVHET